MLDVIVVAFFGGECEFSNLKFSNFEKRNFFQLFLFPVFQFQRIEKRYETIEGS